MVDVYSQIPMDHIQIGLSVAINNLDGLAILDSRPYKTITDTWIMQ